MTDLMTKRFNKWMQKQNVRPESLHHALTEVKNGNVDASLGRHLYKKRIPLDDRGKRGGARTIVVFKKGNRAFLVHGFAKNEKDNLSAKELLAFKEFARILLALSDREIEVALKNGDFVEVIS